ncbi:MAG: helix-turn-helix domain-containing protein [Bacteroidaceae bacterium]|nr:helix-turn-helix domain-containing protein [Bacteroidaceae bacterium]
MKKLPIVMFLFIMMSALCSGICSYRRAESRINQDVNNALNLALVEMPCDIVTADTIRCYRNYLTIPELKETACIAMRIVRRGEEQQTEMVAEANCNFMTVFMLSDQRASSTLFCVGILWMMVSLWYMRRRRSELFVQGQTYGGITYVNGLFMTAEGKQIHLTPMQHSLLEMFMTSENHSLSKQEICNRLWPKKPDASDTLYTLVRRIKPIIEANSKLKIESDRGKSYSLKLK